MSTTDSETRLETLLDDYSKLASQDHRSPAELVRALERDINKTLIPYMDELNDRAAGTRSALQNFINQAIESDKDRVDAIVGGAERSKSQSRQIDREIEDIEEQIKDVVPGSRDHERLVRNIKYKLADYELLVKRLDGGVGSISSSINRFNALIPVVEKPWKAVKGLRAQFTKAVLKLTVAAMQARIARVLFYLLGAAVTLIIDRATPVFEPMARMLAHQRYHEIVILGLFLGQAIAAAPFIEGFCAKQSRRALGRALRTLQELLPELRAVTERIALAETQTKNLYVENRTD